MRWYLMGLLISGMIGGLWGQSAIANWENASFEGLPQAGSVPIGWESHNFDGNTPPDTQPCNYGGVKQKPADGNTYMGLLVHQDNTWESVGQVMDTTLLAGWEYEFSLLACRSLKYYQPEPGNLEHTINAATPVIIRLWGGNYDNPFREFLTETRPISNTDWIEQTLSFKPDSAISYLTFEAYYDRSSYYAYNGNVLIDKLSPIYRKMPSRRPPSAVDRNVAASGNQKQKGNHYYTQARPKHLLPGSQRRENQYAYRDRRMKGRIYKQKTHLTRRELIIQAQQELEASKKEGATESQRDILLYDDPTIVQSKLNRQVPSLKNIPSNAESINVPAAIREPLVRIGPEVLDFVFAVDRAILRELADMIKEREDYTLIIAVHAPLQGVRDKVAWDLDIMRQEMGIDEKIITIEQFTGQNTYFKDWLWKADGQRVMMRLIPRKG